MNGGLERVGNLVAIPPDFGVTPLVNSPFVGQIMFKRNGTPQMTAAKQGDDLNRLTATSSTGGPNTAGPVSFLDSKLNNMKKTLTLTTLSLLAGAVGVYAQGTVNWTDYDAYTFSITVFGVDPHLSFIIENYGNTGNGNDIPSGSAGFTQGSWAANNYGGAPLAGPTYSIGLYLDTIRAYLLTDITSGTPVATYNGFLTGTYAGNWTDAGVLTATTSSVLTAAGTSLVPVSTGNFLYVGLAAWQNTGASGAVSTYAQAVNDGYARGYEVSTGTLELGNSGSPPATTPNLAGIGLTDFSLAGEVLPVPEPSSIALGVIGASAFLMRLRRKN